MTLIRYIKTIIAMTALAAALAMTSCTESGDEPVTVKKDFQIGFDIAVGEQSASRAPSDGEYDPGAGYENYIDLLNGNIKIALFDTSDTYLGEITDFDIFQLETSDSGKRYHLACATDVDLSSGKFKILVLANWPSYPEELSFDNVWKQQYEFGIGSMPSPDNLIPLYGVKLVSLPEIKPDISVNIGKIHLLRAVAKIEVIYDDPSASWTISKLQLSRSNRSGFCAPTGITSQDDYVQDSWGTDYIDRPFIPASTEVLSNVDFMPAGDNRYVLYVPEYDNHNADGTLRPDADRARLLIDFKESIYGERYVNLRNDALPGAPVVDILRNNWYRINIKKVNEQTDVTFEVDVIPYKIVDLDPIFGLGKYKGIK